MIDSSASLQKHVVLATRPQHQLAEFNGLLEAGGYSMLGFPCIEIRSVEMNPQLEKTLRSINDYDLIIFISANAVHQALNLLQSLDIKSADVSTKIATIGKATYKVAMDAGFNVSISPQQGFNSESLLALHALQAVQIDQSHCLIIRGVGGLEQLADELRLRGAQVDYAQVYRREKPLNDSTVQRQQLSANWDSFGIDAITVTSSESLQNLYDMLELSNDSLVSQSAIMATLIIAASERIAQRAESLGFKRIFCAQSATNQHMLDALNCAFE